MTVNISVGDTVRWTWADGGHSVTSGQPCSADSQFCSPDDMNCFPGVLSNAGTVYQHTFANAGTYSYFCLSHCFDGMTGVVNVSGGCAPSGWSAGPDMPTTAVRAVGVYFPANGKFYAMGGRADDNPGSELTNPLEYDPGTNSWTTKAATYPDNHVNNMACGVLADAGTPYIYCVGGSAVTLPDIFDRVFRYDPVTDVISPVAAPWPVPRERLCPVASPSSTTSSISWADSTPSRTEGKRQTRSGSLLPARPPGCRRMLFCLFRSAIYRRRLLALSFTPVEAPISPLALLPIQQTPLYMTR